MKWVNKLSELYGQMDISFQVISSQRISVSCRYSSKFEVSIPVIVIHSINEFLANFECSYNGTVAVMMSKYMTSS
jgi:hypothetical protein